jgi:hypothetical protein
MIAEKKTETKLQLTGAGTVGGQTLELLVECLCVFAILRLEGCVGRSPATKSLINPCVRIGLRVASDAGPWLLDKGQRGAGQAT